MLDMTRRVAVDMDPARFAKLAAIAERNQVGPDEVMRWALDAYPDPAA